MSLRTLLPRVAAAILLLVVLPGNAPAAGKTSPPPGWDGSRYMRVDEIEPGMTGVGRSVFGGTRVEEFQVEILGVLTTASARQRIVLARIAGKGLERSGVVAGMSGSPVYVDGRLLGAVAYGWSFSREPIAGITPIEDMLRIQERPQGGSETGSGNMREGGGGLDPQAWTALRAADADAVFDLLLPPPSRGEEKLTPLAIPVALSGIRGVGTALASRVLAGVGLIPVEGGGSGDAGNEAFPPLEPGSAVGLELVRGDARISAIGTVTWTDGKRILAFGHPMLNRGATGYPMTPAKILTVLPRYSQSFKMGVVGKAVGAVTGDYSSGILGVVGEAARMVPVELELDRPRGTETLHFEILEAPGLTAALAGVVAANAAASLERGGGPVTLRTRTTVTLRDGRRVSRRGVSAGFSPPGQLGAEVARLVGLVDGNPFEPVEIAGIQVSVSVVDSVRAAFLDELRIGPGPYHPGSSVRVTTVLRDYRGDTHERKAVLRLPAELPPGRYMLRACGGSEDRHREEARAPGRYRPVTLDQLFAMLSAETAEDMLVLKILDQEENPVVAGRELPALPSSLKAVLLNPLAGGRVSATTGGVRVVRREDMGRVILGCKTVPLTVEP